jgi:hypothetical protein
MPDGPSLISHDSAFTAQLLGWQSVAQHFSDQTFRLTKGLMGLGSCASHPVRVKFRSADRHHRLPITAARQADRSRPIRFVPLL